METEEKKDVSALSIFFTGLLSCAAIYVMIGKALIVISSLHSLKDVVILLISFVVMTLITNLLFLVIHLIFQSIFQSISKIVSFIENISETQTIASKFATTTHSINFSINQFTYTDNNETQSFQLASIHKIVLFGNNSQNQSLNIYYDKDKIYTFYSDMKDWKVLLDRLNAHFGIKIETKTNNGKQILYERKC